ncbi:MAG: cyclodeaminase/cyclohydrolase family protein [Bacillota bacterium]|nr:cyclodeaminase/cyclohydrolase family protein [Bacillota bacterium]
MFDHSLIKKLLDTEDYSTGGGSASALVGAFSAALVAMVARLSEGKNFGLDDVRYAEIYVQTEKLRNSLLEGAVSDMNAFALVRKAYAMTKNTDAERQRRSDAIQKGFIEAAKVPAENACLCREVLDLAKELDGNSNPDAGSDLEVALNLAAAALKGCLANVRINLPMIKDQGKVKELTALVNDL